MIAGIMLGSIGTLAVGLLFLSAFTSRMSRHARREVELAAFAIGVSLLLLLAFMIGTEVGVFEPSPVPWDPPR